MYESRDEVVIPEPLLMLTIWFVAVYRFVPIKSKLDTGFAFATWLKRILKKVTLIRSIVIFVIQNNPTGYLYQQTGN